MLFVRKAKASLGKFLLKAVKPTAWKARLQIGDEVGKFRVRSLEPRLCLFKFSLPVAMYGATKEAKPKQTWKKAAAGDPTAKVAVERVYIVKGTPGGDGAAGQLLVEDEQVEKEDLVKGFPSSTSPLLIDETRRQHQEASVAVPAVKSNKARSLQHLGPASISFILVYIGLCAQKTWAAARGCNLKGDTGLGLKGYRFGRTCVPMSEEDKASTKFEGPGKCFQILGFARRSDIRREWFLGDGASAVFADAADPVPFPVRWGRPLRGQGGGAGWLRRLRCPGAGAGGGGARGHRPLLPQRPLHAPPRRPLPTGGHLRHLPGDPFLIPMRMGT